MNFAKMPGRSSGPPPCAAGVTARWRGLSLASRRLRLVGAVLVTAMAVATGLLAWMLYEDAKSQAEREIAGLSVAIAEQTARALQGVDLQVREMRDQATRAAIKDSAGFRTEFGTEAIHTELVERTRNLPQAGGLVVIDARGKRLNSSRAWPVEPIDLSDREFYQNFEAEPGDGTVNLSGPALGRTTGRWTIWLARGVATTSGDLAGVIAGAVDLGYFTDLYRSIGLGADGRITLLRKDGVVLAEYPERRGILGTRLPQTSPWYSEARKGSSLYVSHKPVGGGPPLFIATKQVRDYGLVVDVALGAPSVFRAWHRQVLLLMAAFVGGIALTVVLLRALAVQFHRIEAAEAAAQRRNLELEDTRRQLLDKSRTLETTLEHMDQGLLMVTEDDEIRVCNRRTIEMLRIPPEFLTLTPHFKDLVRLVRRAGWYDSATQEVRDLANRGGIAGAPPRYEWLLPDSTVLEVRSVLLRSGGMVRTYTDITEQRQAEDRVRHFAQHDELTGLPNRIRLRERLAEAIDLARRKASNVGVLYLDLDRFKLVNDTRGHAVGDRLLTEVAARLGELVRNSDTVARLGGDEFVVVLAAVHGRESAAALGRRLVASVSQPFEIGGQEISVGLSAGVAMFPEDGTTPEELLRNADLALYRAKGNGRNTVCTFDQGTDDRRRHRMELEEELDEAMRRGQFRVEYQPIWDLRADAPSAMEALVRWEHPRRGRIAPSEFIPLAEETGLIVRLGQWVLETACAEAATWALPVRVAVNVSPVQFRRADLPDHVTVALRASGLKAERLELEITEGVLLEDTPPLSAALAAFEQQGIRMVLDDFGTAHSSLSYLRRYRFAKLKIDRSFIGNICEDAESAALLEAILQIGRALKLDVVAEGIETQGQLDMLRKSGCGHGQGYLLGRPMAAEAARELLWRLSNGSRVAAG